MIERETWFICSLLRGFWYSCNKIFKGKILSINLWDLKLDFNVHKSIWNSYFLHKVFSIQLYYSLPYIWSFRETISKSIYYFSLWLLTHILIKLYPRIYFLIKFQIQEIFNKIKLSHLKQLKINHLGLFVLFLCFFSSSDFIFCIIVVKFYIKPQQFFTFHWPIVWRIFSINLLLLS